MTNSGAKRLIDWYRSSKRDLPWRQNQDPYRVLVSELMLQQTTVASVVPKYDAWMTRFPSLRSLAEASQEEVMSFWSGLGYYQRARNLHRLAKCSAPHYELPNRASELERLPGVGPYTAAAVSSICFEEAVLAIDTNVLRVLYRYYALEQSSQDRAAQSRLRKNVADLFDWISPGDFNQALMELGASICRARSASCLDCPLKRTCLGRRRADGPLELPRKPEKKKKKLTPGTALVLRCPDQGETLLVQGTTLGLLKDLYQPPLLFSQEGCEHPLHRLLPAMISELEPKADSPSLSYGISGRRLLLQIRVYDIGLSKLRNLVSRLESEELPGTLWDGNSRLPLSSLTRRVLQMAEEN